MASAFASAELTVGTLNDMVRKLGGPKSALRIILGELIVASNLSEIFRALGGSESANRLLRDELNVHRSLESYDEEAIVSSELTIGQLDRIVKMLGGPDGVRRLLGNELTVYETKYAWVEKDGLIRSTIMADATRGRDWGSRLQENGYLIKAFTDRLLHSSHFVNSGVGMKDIVVMKGASVDGYDASMKSVRAEALKRGFREPASDIACLLRERLRGRDLDAMKLRGIVVAHKPIMASNLEFLLGVDQDEHGDWLTAHRRSKFGQDIGFAFLE